jgi:hypothetical protein
VVEKRQVFSEEEKTIMFKAYLLKGTQQSRAIDMFALPW